MNKWIGVGRLTKEPELRQTANGKGVCNFTVAVDRRFKVEGQPTADFINCVAWGNKGEFVEKWFTKGKMICLEGCIQTRNWEDDGGNKHYATEILVDNVEFCGDKSNANTKDKEEYNSVENENLEDEEYPF